MALARIISRSHQCSRELALDLLARGYAVEIVSPDAIPDNLADLELRLEADNANQLTASVEAHGGAHAASLDFVHHLKAPMGDFVRRPPQTSPPVSYPAQPVSFNAEPGVEDVELPSESWHAPEPAQPKLEIMPAAEESARLITPPEQVPPPAKEPVKHVRRGLTLRLHRPEPKQLLAVAKEIAKQVRRGLTLRLHRSEPKQTRVAHSRGWWFWRPGMAFVAVVVLALVLGRGIRWGGATSADPASQVGSAETAAPSGATLQTNDEPKHAAAPSVAPTTAGKSEAKSAQISNAPVTPRGHTNSKKSGAVRSRSREDDLVARDTVIYFGRSAPVSPVKDARRRASSRKQRGAVVSADTSHF